MTARHELAATLRLALPLILLQLLSYAQPVWELGYGTNRREADQDPTAHAELLAIHAAVRSYGDGWRLTDCTLAVTLEPCAMCAGALVGARLGRLVFGAYEPKTGACGSAFDIVRDPSVLHKLEVRGGVLERECADLLKVFFSSLRWGHE